MLMYVVDDDVRFRPVVRAWLMLYFRRSPLDGNAKQRALYFIFAKHTTTRQRVQSNLS